MFKAGIPADDTIARTISAIKPEQFQARNFQMDGCCSHPDAGELIAIDGKTLAALITGKTGAGTIL